MASPSTFEGVWGVLPEKVDLEKPEGSELSLWYWPGLSVLLPQPAEAAAFRPHRNQG